MPQALRPCAVRTLTRQPPPAGIYASRYAPELAAHICARLRAGESLRSICRADAAMPTEKTVWNWRRMVPGFERAYGLAVLAARAQALAVQDVRDEQRRAEIEGGLRAPSGRTAWNRGVRRYPVEVMAAIFDDLAQGLSLQEACRAPDRPCVATVYNWMRAFPEARAAYRAAKERGIYWAVERAMDGPEVAWQGGYRASMRVVKLVERAALRRCAALAPKRYADAIYRAPPPFED